VREPESEICGLAEYVWQGRLVRVHDSWIVLDHEDNVAQAAAAELERIMLLGAAEVLPPHERLYVQAIEKGLDREEEQA
jgi:hypothetical protein